MGILQSLKTLIGQTQIQLIYSFAFTTLFFTIEFFGQLVELVERDSGVPGGTINNTVTDRFMDFVFFLNELPYADSLITGLFFAIAALVVYVLYIAFSNMFVMISNEVMLESDYDEATIRKHIASKMIRKAAMALAYIGFLILSLSLFLRFWYALVEIYFNSGFELSNLLFAAVGYIMLAFNLYFIWVLGRITLKYEQAM